MGRLQSIEKALSSINQASFQEMCDRFLALRNNNYSAFSRTGSQIGKQKTIKGTPDTFLLLPNGRYIFVEYSTNITAGIKKLEDDLKKCIDYKKTGIPVNQIVEIILCVNFNLKAFEIQSLRNILTNTRIAITVYTLDSLAIELYFHHRNLAHDYLGLPLDTGQIVSIEKFISEYNKASRGISTPLDNPFLHREEELNKLKKELDKNDFIIITGAPGVGKTKLALEGIKSFLTENLTFGAYCISYKHHTLLDDLYQYFDQDKDYILFVDDANRIDAFSQITGFYKSSRKGSLKIIITVRDYAFQEIGILCQEFSPKRIDLAKFTDEQIVDIIKVKPFEILNSTYQKVIVRIADGNPRLAIMTALLANAKQNIDALQDVSELFENYFSNFIIDDGEFAKEFNTKCLGLISFFYTIPYKNKELTDSILNNFEMDYSKFIEAIDLLEKLELVEIQFEHVKIPEQNLSTYFFYKAFIKDGLLSFETLLSKYFDNNSNRFKDCVIPANNTFGAIKVMDKLKPVLQNHWGKIKSDEEKAYKFLSTFWYYLQFETLAFVFNVVESLPQATSSDYNVKYEINAFSYDKNNVIELLGELLRHQNNLKDVLELGFEYARKKPSELPEWVHKIKERLTFDREDEFKHGFARQEILFQILLDGVNNGDSFLTTIFFELSKTFLSFKFNHTEGGRNNTIYWYDYPVPNTPKIQSFREHIWNTLNLNFYKYPDDAFSLLESYILIRPDVSKEIMEFDIQFILKIIDRHLTNKSFEHCKYVNDLIRWFKRNSVIDPSFNSLSQKFKNPTYKMYLKIDWDRYRDREYYEFSDFREYEELKEKEIRNSFIFENRIEMIKFYNTFLFLKKVEKNQYNYNKTLDFIIDENCKKNFKVGCMLLDYIIKNNNTVNYIPRIAFQNHLRTKEEANFIWNILNNNEFDNKGLWELSFYDYLDDSLITKEHVQSLLKTVSELDGGVTIPFERIQRFQLYDKNLLNNILRIIVVKNETEETRLQLWMDFFENYFDKLGNDIELIKKAYIQQDRIQSHFDYEGKGLINILKNDLNFLVEYVNSLYSKTQLGFSADYKNLSFVWQIEGIEKVLIDVFNLVIEKEPYFGISAHFCNTFFKNLQGHTMRKASNFILDYCKENFSDINKMNVIVDIVRHSLKEMFEEILLLFISLCQDKDLFSKIYWRGSGTFGSGDVILADIEMAEWRNILSIVERSSVGIKLLPIKTYLSEQIEYCKRRGDWERQRRFLERY